MWKLKKATVPVQLWPWRTRCLFHPGEDEQSENEGIVLEQLIKHECCSQCHCATSSWLSLMSQNFFQPSWLWHRQTLYCGLSHCKNIPRIQNTGFINKSTITYTPRQQVTFCITKAAKTRRRIYWMFKQQSPVQAVFSIPFTRAGSTCRNSSAFPLESNWVVRGGRVLSSVEIKHEETVLSCWKLDMENWSEPAQPSSAAQLWLPT